MNDIAIDIVGALAVLFSGLALIELVYARYLRYCEKQLPAELEYDGSHHDEDWEDVYPDDIMAEDDKQRAADINASLHGGKW